MNIDVVIDADYNDTTRVLHVKVSGDVKSNFKSAFGSNVALTIYITEDSLVGKQQTGTDWVLDYVHKMRVVKR